MYLPSFTRSYINKKLMIYFLVKISHIHNVFFHE
jgi:hypothetical protein